MLELANGLRERAGEIDREIQTYERRIGLLRADLSMMRAMMIFQEREIEPEEYLPHISPRRLFTRNEIRDVCLRSLNQAGGPLDTRQLAVCAIAAKGMDTKDIVIRKKIVFSVQQSMKTARRKGFILSSGRRNGVVLWELVGGKLPDPKRLKW